MMVSMYDWLHGMKIMLEHIFTSCGCLYTFFTARYQNKVYDNSELLENFASDKNSKADIMSSLLTLKLLSFG